MEKFKNKRLKRTNLMGVGRFKDRTEIIRSALKIRNSDKSPRHNKPFK